MKSVIRHALVMGLMLTPTITTAPRQPKLMINLGAACYANTGLQCLFATQSFTKRLESSIVFSSSGTLAENAARAYNQYSKLQDQRNTILNNIDRLDPTIKKIISIKAREAKYLTFTEYRDINQQYQKWLKEKELQEELLKSKFEQSDALKEDTLCAILSQMAKDYTDKDTPSVITNGLAIALGDVSNQQDAAESIGNLLKLANKDGRSIPTSFTINKTRYNSLIPEVNLELLKIMTQSTTTAKVQSALENMEQPPQVLILSVEGNSLIPLHIQDYHLVGSAWRSGEGIEGHYFAVVQYNNQWYRLDEPENYTRTDGKGDIYTASEPPPQDTMIIGQDSTKKIFSGGFLTLDSFNIPHAGKPNSPVTCRILVYERERPLSTYIKPHKTKLHDALSMLNSSLQSLSAALP